MATEENIKVAKNGVFIWKITNMSEKVRSFSFHNSEPFYISDLGYKVQLRMNFNLNEQGKLSLFLHLCKGEHDDFLTWPFKARIKFEIIGQKSSMVFNTVEGNICNNRPKEKNKTGFGFVDFFTISELENNHVFEDDCMYIKVRIITDPKKIQKFSLNECIGSAVINTSFVYVIYKILSKIF